MAIAFVCTAAPAFLLTKVIGKHLESLIIMGSSLVIGGVVMWVIDALYTRGVLAHDTDHVEEMSLGQAVWIGLCQTLSAVFPGTSRSMSTIAAGQLVGMSRSAALEFSFFLSIPTMVVATFYDLFKSVRPHHGEPAAIGHLAMSSQNWITLANWLRGQLHRRLWRGCLVHELGADPRLCALCGLPDCGGVGSALVRPQIAANPSCKPAAPIALRFCVGLRHNDLALALIGRQKRG